MKKGNYKGVFYLAIIIIIACILHSCQSTQSVFDAKDLSYLYNPTKNVINPRFGIYNQTAQQSILSIKFFNTDLYFNEANPKGVPMAMLNISVRLYNISQGKTLVDTALYNLDIVKEVNRDEYLYRIPLNVEKSLEYVAELKIVDKIRQQMTHTFVPFNTLSENNRYNFYARGHFLHNDLLNPVIRKNEYLNLVYTKNPTDSIFISFYKPYEGIVQRK